MTEPLQATDVKLVVICWAASWGAASAERWGLESLQPGPLAPSPDAYESPIATMLSCELAACAEGAATPVNVKAAMTPAATEAPTLRPRWATTLGTGYGDMVGLLGADRITRSLSAHPLAVSLRVGVTHSAWMTA